MSDNNENKTKTVFAAVCGRANAGKSTLVNLLVGEKVAIVSQKPQTTRTRINGVLTANNTQYVFTDTPGLHKARNALSRQMLKSIRSGITGVDVILAVADCTKKPAFDRELLDKGADVILLLNKVDLIKDKNELLAIMEQYMKLYDYKEIIPISAADGTNTDKIIPLLDRYAKESEYYFDPELPTDQAERVWLSEIIREKLLNALREEIPHGIAVQIETFEHGKTNKGAEIMDISAAIICEKKSHKGVVIGKQGVLLKKIGGEARLEMEEYFGCKVNLKLWVKVMEDWRDREKLINEFGLKAD